jgi:hypothetical protein
MSRSRHVHLLIHKLDQKVLRRSVEPATLTSRSDFSEADVQRIKLTGDFGEQRENCDQRTTSHH